jgi:ubiquinone/menaquinone biosynthesis C-methylase UbiE
MNEPTPAPEAFFDGQARTFEHRAGLPLDARSEIARALVELGRLDPNRGVLDIGAGTGDIGLELVALGVRYLGLDQSEGMLGVFRQRATAAGVSPSLVVADARDEWPVPAGGTCLVFGSRSLHWLDPRHVAAQAFRAASPAGARLVVGRVLREETSPKQRARRTMRDFVAQRGFDTRSGKRGAAALISECMARGAVPFPPRVVATWTVQSSIRASIDAWRAKPGLAGVVIPEDAKRDILDDVVRFTSGAFGNIDDAVVSTERYVLEGATLTDEPA